MCRPLGEDTVGGRGKRQKRSRIGAKTIQVSMKIQIPKEKSFPINKREKERKERKTNKQKNRREVTT